FIPLLAALLAFTTLTSCENFLHGEQVKQDLIDYIAYCNAKECTLYISQDSSTGVFLSSAKQKCRVGYTTELQVTVNTSNYVFKTLDAVSINDLNISREDCVEYKTEIIDEDKGIYKITIKLLKEAHDILICPVCSLIPKITGVTPAIETSGCEQDLEIKVSFNKAMDRESFADFSCLKITSDGEDLTSLFATPFFTSDGTTLVITPLCASQSEDFSSSFLLEPSGNVNTRKITVEFKFTGDQKDKEGIPITGYSEYTYKVNKNLSQNELPSMQVEITGDSGDFTPTIGIKDCIKTYTYQLSFRPYDDYEFIRWEIFNKVNGAAITNGSYITIENPNDRNTTFTFAALPEDDNVLVAVRPVVVERPEIFSYSPQQSSNNTYKDSMIQFIFDNDMDPSSIYYSKDEIQTINAYYNIDYANFLPAVDPAELADGATLQNHYGYKQGSGTDEEYIYKNISITLQGTDQNMNKCFDAPVFEGKRVVTIPSSKTAELPNYAVVQVSINKNFCFIKDGIPVVMKKSKNWTYQVSKQKDGDGPVLSYDTDVKVSFPGTNGKEIIKGTCPVTPWQTGNNQIYNNEQKLRLELKIHDEGIGPADMFTLKLEKVMDSNYETSSVDYEKSIKFHSISIATNDATFEDSEVDLSGLNLPDGVYKASFIFRDKSGNPLVYPPKPADNSETKGYYFTIDNAIAMATPNVVDNSDGTGGKIKLSWTLRPDWKKTKIRWKKQGTSQWSNYEEFTNKDLTSKDYSFSGLANLTSKFDFEIVNYDYKGNFQTINLNDVATAGLDKITVAGTPAKTLYFSNETFNSDGLTVTAYLTNNNSWVINNYSNNLGHSVSTGKAVQLSYTLNGYTREDTIDATYYIAESDALTQSPVKTGTVNLDVTHVEDAYKYAGTDIPYPDPVTTTRTFDLYKFGDFPQTKAANQEDSYYSEETVYHGWYLGSDGYFYEKFGGKYYKVEPIIWRVLLSENGKLFLFSKNIIMGNILFYDGRDNDWARDLDGYNNNKTIYANNYEFSTMRAYLNGLSYLTRVSSSAYADYMIDHTYEGNGFLQKAFTDSAQQNYIIETEVDNSIVSARPAAYNDWSTYSQERFSEAYIDVKYVCNNTKDKVFLLSRQECSNLDYGFYEWLNNCDDSARNLASTDYAKANNVSNEWWLRTPNDSYNQSFTIHSFQGREDCNFVYKINPVGIAPAMWIELP
ncbi:MAG: DUF6273 domain-containing protein, partial [Treponema sp.]|nr:DUF6273 domain-containing protein [Treponema sp.]